MKKTVIISALILFAATTASAQSATAPETVKVEKAEIPVASSSSSSSTLLREKDAKKSKRSLANSQNSVVRKKAKQVKNSPRETIEQ